MARLVRILRVEHERTREGPFGAHASRHGKHGLLANVRDRETDAMYDPPGPGEDTGGETPATLSDRWDLPHREVRFGFASRAQVLRWFRLRSLWDDLGRDRFVVSEYEVPADRVQPGRSQIMFDQSSARLVAQHPPGAFGAAL